MKKNLLFAATALVALFGTTSCLNEVDMFKKAGTGKISLSITNDDAIETRATKNVTESDGWVIKVGETEYTLAGLTAATFTAGDYSIKASSHANEAAATATADNARGAAYYEGSQQLL